MTVLILLLSYLTVLYLIYRLVRRNPVSLSLKELAMVFSAKVLAAWGYGYLFLTYYNGDDTWQFFNTSIQEKQLLLNDPALFFRSVFPDFEAQNNLSALQKLKAVLDHLEYAAMNKIPAIFNLVSGDNYYINCIFFSFITFWGHYWLFVFFTERFPQKRTLLLLLCFLFPPALFWLSGFRADGMVLSALGLYILSVDRYLRTRETGYLLTVISALLVILILRNQFAILLFPPTAAWAISVKLKKPPAPIFLFTYGMGILLFFGSLFLGEKNLPAIVVKKQQEFFSLQANTRVPLDSLKPDPISFLKVMPQALNNTFLRPFPWEAKGVLQLLAAAENILILLLFLWFLVTIKTYRNVLNKPFIWMLFFFCITLYLFIGYTVPFPGAIIRYRIIPELILITVLTTQLSCRIKKNNI